ncbi:ndufs1 NADH-ubiquinone oxidoreductase subunit [Coemansia aciculifera]|nr:ndufs1 NADH-ubiquinone oxidoreductase subunit [Coemansia aciculifera]
MQIGTYVARPLASELSGNISALCPVGALTAKPSAFAARPWELTSTESVDVMDALGSAIRVDSRGAEVIRIVPRTNDLVNEEWLGDKARFAYDGLKRQRLTVPLVRVGGRLEPASWADALQLVGRRLRATPPADVAAVAGDLADAESLVALKDLINAAGSERLGVDSPIGDGLPADGGLPADVRAGYTFGATLAGVEDADAVLLVATNPRCEAPVLNARLRKPYLAGSAVFGVVGDAADLTFDYDHVGSSLGAVDALRTGDSAFARALRAAKRPLVIVGAGAAEQRGGGAVLAAVARLAEAVPALLTPEWNGLCVLQNAAGRTAALDIGYSGGSADASSAQFVYLLGADRAAANLSPSAFVVFQGHHGDAGALAADVVLPGLAYTEKSATFVNTEGRVQRTRQAVAAPGAARPDWQIIRALSDSAGLPLAYDDVAALRARMADVCPALVNPDVLEPTSAEVARLGVAQMAKNGGRDAGGALSLSSVIADYYMSDPISRASRTMAKASAMAKGISGQQCSPSIEMSSSSS